MTNDNVGADKQAAPKPVLKPKLKPTPVLANKLELALSVSNAPHLKGKKDTARIMRLVSIALIPALAASVYFHGWRSLVLTAIGAVSAVVFEALTQWLMKKPITIADGSAIVTGILLAFNLPYNVPFWMPIIGSFVAIAIAKQAFGGLGFNLFNPALVGRAVLLAAWPVHMTTDWSPLPNLANISGTTIDAISSATPLAALKASAATIADPTATTEALAQANEVVSQLTGVGGLSKLALGQVGGTIGETSAILLLLGALFLVIVKVVDWRIPAGYFGTVIVFMSIFGWVGDSWTGLFHLLAGGLMLGVLFMATDMVTSPVTKKGRLIFGIGAGLLAAVIRLWGGYPEGVSYSILLMNAATPLIDRFTVPKFFGAKKKEARDA